MVMVHITYFRDYSIHDPSNLEEFDYRHYITYYNSDYGACLAVITMDTTTNRFLLTWENEQEWHQHAIIFNADGTPYSSDMD